VMPSGLSSTNYAISFHAGTLTVSKAYTTTTLVSSLDPSTYGQDVTFTATVTANAPSTINPASTGSVTFKDGSTTLCSAVAIDSGGKATCAINSLDVAGSPHSITAIYSGDSNYKASPASTASSQGVNQAGTTTSVGSSSNPSVYGQPVTFTATVVANSPSSINPTTQGSITFSDGTTTLCNTVPLSSGKAMCSLNTLGASVHTIAASYSGDSNYKGSNASLSQKVNIAATTTVLVSNSNPSVYGQSVTFTATVTANSPSTINPTNQGSATFNDGSVTLCNAVALSGGQAPCTLNSLDTVGSPHSIVASFSGDSNYSTSSRSFIQTVNKSSTISAVTVTPNPAQYSDVVTLTATLSPANVLGHAPATSVTFIVGTQVMGTASLVADSTNSQLIGTLPNVALLEPTPFGTAPTGQMAPGSHLVTAQFNNVDAAHFVVSNPTTSLMIKQEDARTTYTGIALIPTSCTSCTSANVSFSATIQDVTAVPSDPAYDPNPGDIRNATVKFVDVTTAGSPKDLCSAAVGLVSLSDTKTGTATCNATLTASATSGGTPYTIETVVNGYYTNGSSDDTEVNVYIPQSNFITGGGFLTLQSSAGLYPGQTGTKNNFGFNVKYNKSGTNLQGNINVIVRNNGRVYQIKGNSMTSLAVQVCTGTGCPTAANPSIATFNGKASIQDITDPLNPISIDGNATLQVTMHDCGSPGTSDTIGITVWNKSGGMWFSSNWTGTKTAEQLLGGGDLAVH